MNDAITFYKQLDVARYKNLKQHAVNMASLFGSTYDLRTIIFKNEQK